MKYTHLHLVDLGDVEYPNQSSHCPGRDGNLPH